MYSGSSKLQTSAGSLMFSKEKKKLVIFTFRRHACASIADDDDSFERNNRAAIKIPVNFGDEANWMVSSKFSRLGPRNWLVFRSTESRNHQREEWEIRMKKLHVVTI